MHTFETIEQYSFNLLDRLKSYLQKRSQLGSETRRSVLPAKDIDWPIERPECGGYNEAYVMHLWASFR